jgi:hypothetical protein
VTRDQGHGGTLLMSRIWSIEYKAMKKVTKKKEIWAEKLQKKSVFIKSLKKELNYIYYK